MRIAVKCPECNFAWNIYTVLGTDEKQKVLASDLACHNCGGEAIMTKLEVIG